MFASHDQGKTWNAIGSPVPASRQPIPININEIVAGPDPATLYAVVQNVQSSVFVSKLSPDGSTLLFSTFLNGHAAMDPVATYAEEPAAFFAQNFGSAITLDGAGNVVVGGLTRANDFLGNSAYGRADAFVAAISSDGSQLIYSTNLGGSKDDGALTVTLDPQGNVIVAGQTWSGAAQPGDAFIAKLSPAH